MGDFFGPPDSEILMQVFRRDTETLTYLSDPARTHLHGVGETLDGVSPQQQFLEVLAVGDLRREVRDVRLLRVEVFEPLQLADVRHEDVDAVAADVEHAQPSALPDGGRHERQVALGDEQDLQPGELTEGGGETHEVVRVVASQAVLAQVEVGQVEQAADVGRDHADVVARHVESPDVVPWWGRLGLC